MKKPEKLYYRVYESVNADPEYKMHKGVVYNDHMYQEAVKEYRRAMLAERSKSNE